MSSHDVLGAEGRLPRRGLRVVVIAALVAAVTGFGADRWQQHREADRLLRCVIAGQDQVGYAFRKVAATLTYSSPALTAADSRPVVRASLTEIVQKTARDAVPAVRASGALCSQGNVLRWHPAQRGARSRYLDYLGHEADRLAAVGRDLEVMSTTDAEGAVLRTRALAAVRSAVPGGAQPTVLRLLGPVSP